jgi:hypothetical protein
MAEPSSPGLVLLHHNLQPNDPFWLGSVIGQFQIRRNCTYIIDTLSNGEEQWVALWPDDVALRQGSDTIMRGAYTLAPGEYAMFSGGELDSSQRADLLVKLLGSTTDAQRCGATRFWVVTGFEPMPPASGS